MKHPVMWFEAWTFGGDPARYGREAVRPLDA